MFENWHLAHSMSLYYCKYCEQLLQFMRVTVAIISFLPKGEGRPNIRVPVTHVSNERYYCDY